MRVLAQLGFVVGVLLIGSGAAQRQSLELQDLPSPPAQFSGIPCSDVWHPVLPAPTGNWLNAAAFDPTIGYVVVGDEGTLLTSSDGGENWVLQDPGTDLDLTGVACSHGVCVMVGGRSNGAVMLRTLDGKVWTKVPLLTVKQVYSVSTNGSMFLASGSSMLRSSDGEHWQDLGSSGVTNGRVIWTGGEFFVVGGTQGLARSRDGIAWRLLWSQPFSSDPPAGVASDGSTVVVTSRRRLYTTRDGKTWSSLPSPPDECSIGDVVWTGREFLTVSAYCRVPELGGGVWSSNDGFHWSKKSDSRPAASILIATQNGFLGVGGFGRISSSPDGTTWTTHSSGSTLPILDVIWDGSQFIAVGNGGITTSHDGLLWTERVRGYVGAVCNAGGQLVATAQIGSLLTSQDGESWLPTAIDSRATLRTMAWSGTHIVAAGSVSASYPDPERAEVLVSNDGRVWERIDLPESTRPFERVVWLGREFAAAGPGQISTSPDGRVWSTVDLAWEYPSWGWPRWTSIATNGFTTLALGYSCDEWTCDGFLATKVGQKDWQCRYDPPIWQSENVYWLGTHFLSVGSDGWHLGAARARIMVSPDGETWAAQRPRATTKLRAFATNGQISVAVGEMGTILRNDCWASVPVRRHLGRGK